MADHEHERVADPPPTTDSSVNYVKKRCRHRKQEIYQNYFSNERLISNLNYSELLPNQFFE